MPDRAVVDDRPIPGPGCDHCEGGLVLVVGRDKSWEETCPRCGPKSIPWSYAAPIDAGLPEPQPRALVALSEDRQWLVVLDVKNVWNVMEKRYGQATHGFWWKSVQDIRDTGQDAHAVLAEWMEGQG